MRSELFSCICLQVELTDREFEKMLAVEEKQKQKKEGKLKKKPKREHHGPKSRILNRKHDRRSKVALNESKSDESGDEVDFVVFIAECVVLCQCNLMSE